MGMWQPDTLPEVGRYGRGCLQAYDKVGLSSLDIARKLELKKMRNVWDGRTALSFVPVNNIYIRASLDMVLSFSSAELWSLGNNWTVLGYVKNSLT